jgi:hypothetical protein
LELGKRGAVTKSTMRVCIDTNDIKLVIANGRVSSFKLKHAISGDIETFMGGLARLTKTIDEMYLRAVNVAHVNHAINRKDWEELSSLLKSQESGFDLNCNCKNCFLSYVRGFIEMDQTNEEFFAKHSPTLYRCIVNDKTSD